jgi:beta-phosphoglucomutase-like phosphatase (HAD superfamily)
MKIETAFLFDLDGTLVDSVYQHVLSWKEVLDAEGMEISIWRISQDWHERRSVHQSAAARDGRGD